jgi:hypothetical protein
LRRKYDAFATQIFEVFMDAMLQLVLEEGEGLKVEFKERLSNLDREIDAFANTSGGVLAKPQLILQKMEDEHEHNGFTA